MKKRFAALFKSFTERAVKKSHLSAWLPVTPDVPRNETVWIAHYDLMTNEQTVTKARVTPFIPVGGRIITWDDEEGPGCWEVAAWQPLTEGRPRPPTKKEYMRLIEASWNACLTYRSKKSRGEKWA